MKNIIWLFLLGLLACSSNIKTVEVQNDNGVVIERYEQNIKTAQKDGKSDFFSDDGALLETAFYKNGVLNGKRVLYHENGEIQAIEQYTNGTFTNIYQAFYENNQLELGGELMEIVTFVENEENGPFVEYYKNGKTKAAGAYLDGDNEHGELKLFDENGELTKKMNCEKGICRTSWTKEEEEKKI